MKIPKIRLFLCFHAKLELQDYAVNPRVVCVKCGEEINSLRSLHVEKITNIPHPHIMSCAHLHIVQLPLTPGDDKPDLRCLNCGAMWEDLTSWRAITFRDVYLP